MPRLAGIRGYEEQKQKLADLASVNNPVPEKLAYADRPKAVQEQPASVVGAAKASSPALDKMTWKNTGITPMAGQGEYRTQALRDMDEADFAKNQGAMNASDYEYWTQQVKANPDSTYAILNQMYASQETPEEKAKRERREALGETFRGLGNLIGNVANLYYTHRGGQYIDLNSVNEKHRERMRRIKEKQDALKQKQDELLGKAKLADVKAKRDADLLEKKTAAAAKEKAAERAFKLKFDAYMKELDHAHKMGQIDAQTAANMKRDAAKATSDKELESFKQSNRIALKTTPSYGQDKVLTSVTGADGNVYTRNSKLDNVEIRELAKYVEDWGPYTTVDEDGNEKVDYIGAIADAADTGLIPVEVLEQRGYKKGKASAKKGNSLGLGIGGNNKNGNKLGIGL